MTQDKELLLKDLCARLPYGVKGDAKGKIVFIMNTPIEREPEILTNIDIHTNTYGVSCQKGIPLYNRKGEINFKPYLFPLSSMTEAQQEEFDRIYADDMQVVANNLKNRLDGKPYETNFGHYRHIDWLNAHHFDYRELIEKGLAIDATGLNIY